VGGVPVIRRAVAVIGLAAALLVGGTAPALAHEQFESSEPAEGDTLAEVPTRIVLTFSGNVVDPEPQVVLRNEDGGSVGEALPVVDGPTVTLPLDPSLANGLYTVEWGIDSSDGHAVSGEFSFAVEAPRTAAPSTAAPNTAGSTAAAPTTEAAPTAAPGDPQDEAVDEAAAAEDSSAAGWWLVVGVAALAIAAAVAVVVVRRRRGA
jgi:copper resistance protein C